MCSLQRDTIHTRNVQTLQNVTSAEIITTNSKYTLLTVLLTPVHTYSLFHSSVQSVWAYICYCYFLHKLIHCAKKEEMWFLPVLYLYTPPYKYITSSPHMVLLPSPTPKLSAMWSFNMCGLYGPWQENTSLKNAVFWDIMPRGSWKNRRFGGT
jgi:hypothetical protein